MADLSDVEAALVNSATQALYPQGVANPSSVGAPVRIFRGWPLAALLEQDLSAGVSNVSVFSVPGTGRDTTRWSPVVEVTPGLPTLTVQTLGTSATFGGLGGVGQVAGLLVDETPFVYRSVTGDTAILVAAVLAEAVRATRACWLSASTITVPQAVKLSGRVAADGSTLTEWTRQAQDFRITAWCSNPTQRDQLCSIIGGALAMSAFVTLADGSAGRVRYRTSASVDDHQDAKQYRRDLIYEVEYGTTVTTNSAAMLFGDLSVSGATTYG